MIQCVSVPNRETRSSHTCHGAGAAVGPAGATVLGNVLVAGRAHIVGAVDVPPVPGFGQIRNVYVLMRTRSGPVNGQAIRYISSAAATHSIID